MESPGADCNDDRDSAIETESNCSYEETAAKIEMALRRSLKLDLVDGAKENELTTPDPVVDVKTLPGYQEVPPNCPSWKKTVIEKKNKQLEEDALRELMAKKQEEDRWKNVPEWKKQIILEKERKKQEEITERRRQQEMEMGKLSTLPEWKRNLVIRKRENDS